MYIHAPGGFGDPQPAPAQTSLLKKTPPLLTFFRVDGFVVDKATLTPRLKQMVKQLADAVRASWQTMRPIGVVRLVGHTDASGAEQHNVGLGNRRAEAVRQELYVQLRALLNKVAIDVGTSPGKSQPRADNRTAAGRAANRRVDVFIEGPIPPAGTGTRHPWPPTVPDPDRDGPWDPFRFKRGMPGPLGAKTPRQFLMDLCEGRFGTGTCKTLVDRALSLGCKGIEALFERLGGTITEAQKQEVRRQCGTRADKPL
jgi:hypothetical protein